MKVLVTGSNGFVGRNLCAALERVPGVDLFRFDIDSSPGDLDAGLTHAAAVYHLAGVNRPETPAEFEEVNAGFTRALCARAIALGRRPKIVFASSTQALLDNPYGRSKRAAEAALEQYASSAPALAAVYRLSNLFGKWGRPDYNSVTATFCHRIARDLPVAISDPAKIVELTYIDDVVDAFLGELPGPTPDPPGFRIAPPLTSHPIALGALAATIHSFRDECRTLFLPDLGDPFVRALRATYLSHLDPHAFLYRLEPRADARGALAEVIKSTHAGQIFVSRTRPGVTRGNHFHASKTEKFLVLEGEALIRLRRVDAREVTEYRVSGRDLCVVDIPPGYTHSITNAGSSNLLTLFWASEPFDPAHPDTHAEPVDVAERA